MERELHGFQFYHFGGATGGWCYVWVMKRLVLVCAAVVWMAGCGGDNAAMREPPQGLEGGAWLRQAVERPSVEGAPAALKSYRPKEWMRTEYSKGESVVKVDVFRMPGEPSAFEARQKYLGESGTASLNHGDLFVVVSSATEPAQGLGRFLRLVEAEWLSAQAH